MHVPLTPLSMLERAGDVHGPDIGIVEGDRRVTYGEVRGEARALACGLRSAGIAKGDRVAWLGPNTARLLTAYFGVPGAGAVLLPLNIRLSCAEMARILQAAGASALIVDRWQAREPELPPGAERLDYDDLVAGGPGGDQRRSLLPPGLDENDPAEMFYTSGSTGRSKGVVLSHRALYLHGIHSALTLGLSEADVVLHTIPLFHVNGWGTPHSLTVVGGRHVMIDRFDTTEVLRLIASERVTRLFLVPTMLRMLLADPMLDGTDLSSITGISLGGAPTPPVLFDEAERRLGAPMYSGYGLTETCPTLLRALPLRRHDHDPARRAAIKRTTGRAPIGVEVKLVAREGAAVPRDARTVGEIVARSNHVMDRYWDDPVATADAIRDGWFHTGDLGTWDGEGFVTIVDRAKDLIITGGENVSSVEVEAVLASHPAVADACVVGAPDEHWGEVPVAFVSLLAGCSIEPAELLAWARAQIAHFKAPRRIVIKDSLPLLGTGKIAKAALREEAKRL